MNFSLLHSFYVTIQKVSRGHSSILQRALISYSPMKVHSPETLSAPDKAARGTAVLLCKAAARLKPDARQVLRPAGSAAKARSLQKGLKTVRSAVVRCIFSFT